MGKLNQEAQIRQSQVYDDTKDVTQAEISAQSLADDLDNLRSQFKNVIGEANWYDLPISNIRDLSQDIGLSTKVVFYDYEGSQVTVPLSQNFVALMAAGEFPTVNTAINPDTDGAIVALLPGNAGAAHSMNTATSEGNLVQIREAATNNQILDTSGNPIFGLLQVDSGSVDGDPFQPMGNNGAQISFVYRDPLTENLVPAGASSIENKMIEYSYQHRQALVDAREDFATTLNFSRPIAQITGSLNIQQDSLTVNSNGQTAFTLSQNAVPGRSVAYVNGIVYHETTDYLISGTTFTWLDNEFTLSTTDELIVEYQV